MATDDLLERRLRRHARHLDTRTRLPEVDVPADGTRVGGPRSPWRLLVAAAAVFVVVGAGLWMARPDRPEPGPVEVVDTSPTSTTTGVTSTSSTREPRRLANGWTELPPPPIEHTFGAVVWTGREMIVWGGEDRFSGSRTPVSDGAAYDPAARTWRVLSPAPPGLAGSAFAAWTDDRMVVVTEPENGDTARAALYDPATDRWTEVAEPPVPTAARLRFPFWTGREVVVVHGVWPPAGDGLVELGAVALDPTTGRWRRLDGFDRHVGFLPLQVLGTPDGIFHLAGNAEICEAPIAGCATYRPTLLAYDVSSDTAREIDLESVMVDRSDLVLEAVTDDGLLVSVHNDETINPWPRELWLHHREQGWVAEPSQPCMSPATSPAGTITGPAGESIRIGLCSSESSGTSGSGPLLAFHDPIGGELYEVESPAPFELGYTRGIWTGEELVVWAHRSMGGNSYEELAVSVRLAAD